MSDEDTGNGGVSASGPSTGAEDNPDRIVDDGEDGRNTGTNDGVSDVDVWRYLRLGAVGLLSLLAVVATFRLYTSASSAIARWVSPDFVPAFQAAFNLIVLLLALAGLAMLYRWR